MDYRKNSKTCFKNKKVWKKNDQNVMLQQSVFMVKPSNKNQQKLLKNDYTSIRQFDSESLATISEGNISQPIN